MGNKWVFLVLVAILNFSVDQFTKIWVLENFELGERQDLIPSIVQVYYVQNPGAAFGIWAGVQGLGRSLLFGVLRLLVGAFILSLAFKLEARQKFSLVALGSILGGAWGNWTDRFRYSYVIDFISFQPWGRWHWPTFNWADVAIVLGVFYLVWASLKIPERSQWP